MVALVAMETLLNLVWLIADPLTLSTFDSTSVLPYHQCDGPVATAFIATSVAFNVLVACCTAALAFHLRDVQDATHEAKLMAAALYNLILILVISIALTWTASSVQTNHEDFLIPAAAILWCALLTTAVVVAPKLYFALRPPPGDAWQQDSAKAAAEALRTGQKRRSWQEVGMTPEERAERKKRRVLAKEEARRWKEEHPEEAAAAEAAAGGRKPGEADEVELETLDRRPPPAIGQLEEGGLAMSSTTNLVTSPPSEGPQPTFNEGRRNSFSARARPAPSTLCRRPRWPHRVAVAAEAAVVAARVRSTGAPATAAAAAAVTGAGIGAGIVVRAVREAEGR